MAKATGSGGLGGAVDALQHLADKWYENKMAEEDYARRALMSDPETAINTLPQALLQRVVDVPKLRATVEKMRSLVELRCGYIVGMCRGEREMKLEAEAIIKGDATVPAISAASILAKVYRDRWCVAYDEEFPQYGFAVHKGYGTPQHLAALREHGACPQHRKTFSPVTEVLR